MYYGLITIWFSRLIDIDREMILYDIACYLKLEFLAVVQCECLD